MSHYTIDFSKSPCPKADAIIEIKRWLGDRRWDELSPHMATLDVRGFGFVAEFNGVSGFPVKAWYDLYHGDGAYDAAWDEIEAKEASK